MTLSKKILEKMGIIENIKEFFTDNFQEKEFEICEDCFDWLMDNFLDKIFDVWDVIQKLEAEKDSEGYSWWFFKNFKLTGICRGWDENKNLKHEYHYKNGNLKRERCYKNGKWHGSYRVWDENGNLQFEDHYKNGERHGSCRVWDENGNLKFEEHYKNGEKI